MKIKRFFAKDMRTALAEVKEVLGPDAVIMSNKKVSGVIEIVAAVDYQPATKESESRRELRDDSYGYEANMMGGAVSVSGAELSRNTRFATLGLRTGVAGKTTGAFHLQYERQASDCGLAAKAEISIPF